MLLKEREPEKLIMDEVKDLNSIKPDGYRAVLRNKDFLALWIAQIFSQLADRVIFVVFVAVIASNFTSTSTTHQSLLYIAFTIPAVLLTAVAGVFIDKWNKKHILITTNILRAIFIAMLPFFSETIFGIYALAFLVSTVTQFFVPAEASVIPSTVKKNQLMSANSLFTATMMGSIIFGFALGDPLINIFGLKDVNIAISGLFLLSTISLLFIKYKPTKAEETQHKTFAEFYNELKEGFGYIKNNPIIFNALLKLASLFSIIVTMCILAISISQKMLYPDNIALGAQKFVYIVAFSGVGMVLGSLLVGKYFKNQNRYLTIFTGFAVIGASLVFMPLINMIPQSLHIMIPDYNIAGVYFASYKFTLRMFYCYILSMTLGYGAAMAAIPIQTILHTRVPENMRGKVFGVQFTLLSTCSTLPIIVAAYATDLLGISNILLLLGIPVAFFGTWGLLKSKRNRT
jgi:MFS family permease